MFSLKSFNQYSLLIILLIPCPLTIFAQDNPEIIPTQTTTASEIQPTITATTPLPPEPEKQVLNEEKNERFIDSFIGISYIPKAKWSFPKFLNYENEKLKLSLDKNNFMTYDANVRFNKIQTVLGLNAMTDQNTLSGKIHRLSGYIGLKKMYFRIMKGKITGDGTWTSTLATGMPRNFSFDNSISSYDALYYYSNTMYIGLGITKGEVPATVRTLITTGGKVNQKYGNFVYDKDYSFSVVSFLFGFDTIIGTILSDSVVPGVIQPYFSCYDRFGYGSGTISDESVRYAEELNPGKTFVDKKGKLVYLENNSSIGVSWTPSLFRGKAIIGLGYNLFFNSIMPMSGAAETSTELGYDANTGMLKHGPEFRLFAIW